MNIELNKMDGRTQNIYREMWDGFDFNKFGAAIKKTYCSRYKKDSDNSYCFDGEADKEQLLIKTFNIENIGLFKEKYIMAVSGPGGEENRITTLHSSSLCALLHFYNVTDDNPLVLEFQTDKHKRRVEFTESVFEYKSPVIDNPSNMDVVLLGKDKDIVLFLESKFSEYYKATSRVMHEISRKYYEKCKISKPLYENDSLKELGLRRVNESDEYFKLESIDGHQTYIEGIKQMISHYTGVTNVINGRLFEGDKCPYHKRVDEVLSNKNTTVILGEIVFDSKIGGILLRKNVSCLDDYTRKYNILASQIKNHIAGNDRMEIMMEELGYSLFADSDHDIEPNIKKFYRY